MSSFQKMIKQAQQMQAELEQAKGELAELEVAHSCNGIAVIAKGDMTIKSIKLTDEIMKEADKEMLEDLILVAINGALEATREETEKRVSGITGGLMPGLL
jgi:DNA-binding YbaB/EbfC family protein